MIFSKSNLKILFFLIAINCFSQNQKIADSLTKIYNDDKALGNSEKLELLRNLSFNEIENLDLALKYAEELIELAKKEQNHLYLYRGYIQKGNKLRLLGELKSALESYFKSLDAATKSKYIVGQGLTYSTIADVYSEFGNSKNSQIYYDKAIKILRKTNDTIGLASTLLNSGDEYINSGNLQLAKEKTEEAKAIFKKVNYQSGEAYALGNLGMIYAKQDNDKQAEANITQAISLLEKIEDYYPICVYLTYMSDIYLEKGDKSAALNYLVKSLSLAKSHGLKKEISDANLKLSQLYDKLGKPKESLAHLQNHIIYRDSLKNIETVQKIADLRTDFEVSQKQAEVDLLSQQKKNQRIVVFATIIALGFIAFVAFGLYRRNKFVQKTNKIIEFERKRSDDLLRNILPESTAEELKVNGKVAAKRFQSVTVLFTDFHGFTQYAENLSPEKLVESVDYYFSKFDEIIEKYELEKIKTIGDAYMCAGGLPFPTVDHALKTVQAAVEIAAFVEETRRLNSFNDTSFEIRLGINTGPVVAGVVGTKKFAYDIWGDTVNIASRLESNSESGKINISESTYDLIKDTFDCEYRGEIIVKNKGLMKMYFLNSVENRKRINPAVSSLLQTTI
ncbi:MAG: adenylate/guanylate cyclase domain-containing protein [Bacteroidota bacterium]